MTPKRERASELTKELDSILLEHLGRGGDDPDAGHVHFRFGMALLVLSVLTAVLSTFSAVMRTDWFAWLFVGAALFQAGVGAYFVDRSTRLLRRIRRARLKCP